MTPRMRPAFGTCAVPSFRAPAVQRRPRSAPESDQRAAPSGLQRVAGLLGLARCAWVRLRRGDVAGGALPRFRATCAVHANGVAWWSGALGPSAAGYRDSVPRLTPHGARTLLGLMRMRAAQQLQRASR